MENFFFEKFFQKSFYGDGRILTFLILGESWMIHNYHFTHNAVLPFVMGKGRENNET